jgi:ABC-type transport system substrate-binding protein
MGIQEKRIIARIFIVVFIFMIISPAIPVHAQDSSEDIRIGPYIDKVVFREIQEKNQAVLALQSNEIDMIGDWVWFDQLTPLEVDPDISIHRALRSGYGHITINCGKYPLNISGFRRAFAYAYDKASFLTDVLAGYSQLHDSVVPYVNDLYCIEDQLPYHYYNPHPVIGNQILDDLDFEIDSFSGYRNAPDGSSFKVEIMYHTWSEEIAGGAARYAVEALNSLYIEAEAKAEYFPTFISTLDHHLDYDMAFYAFNFHSSDVLWLQNYDSQYVDVPFMNEVNFENDSYDAWCDVLRSCMTYEDAYEAAAAMQLILHENVPRLVVYENFFTQPYRNDVFTGHVGDKTRYLHGQWTFRNIRKLDGTGGGTFRVSYDIPRHTLNPFLQYGSFMSDLIWPSLYSQGPNLELLPNIAESIVMETHADNPKVFDGNTRFTVDIIKNATWTDDTPLTALDIANTYTYIYESGFFGNPWALDILGELVAAYALTPNKAIIEFSTESMWHFSNFALELILPNHIFNDLDGIGYDGWKTWDPGFNPEHPYVTAGPFYFTDLQFGDFFEFSANPDFWYRSQDLVNGPETTTPPPDTPFNTTLAIAAGAVGAASTVLLGGFFMFKRETV